MIPVGMVHSAAVHSLVHVKFVCSHCRYQERCRVVASSEGQTLSPLFLGMKGNRQRAYDQAVEGIPAAAKHAVQLIACPACKRGNRRARLRLGIVSAIEAAIARWPTAILLIGGFGGLKLESWTFFFIVEALGLIAIPICAVWTYRQAIQDASTVVLLTGPQKQRAG